MRKYRNIPYRYRKSQIQKSYPRYHPTFLPSLLQISLTIVFIFIVCHSVKWIPNLYELGRLAMDDKRSWPPWVECVTHIAHFLMTLNSSTNFYIYCGKHFNVIPKVT